MVIQPQTEISCRRRNLFSAEQVAKAIGAYLGTINDWLVIGTIDCAVFGAGQFSRYEQLDRAALIFELVRFELSPSCASGTQKRHTNLPPNDPNDDEEDEEDEQDEPEAEEPAVVREPDEC